MPGPRLLVLPGAEVRIFSDPLALSLAVRDEFVRVALESVKQSGRFTVALAGGSTPQQAYSLLASDSVAQQKLPWERIHAFFGDERCVPSDHSESNFRMARTTLLDHVPIPVSNIHPLRGGEPPEESAMAAEDELRDFFQLPPGGFPEFDLVMLGLGADGHTASLFPGSEALEEQTRLVRANWVATLGVHRLTMTFPVLNAAKEILFTASGSGKADVLRQILEPPPAGTPFPASKVHPSKGRLLWFVDAAAAGNLAATS